MKVAILGESSADEAAVKVLVEAVLGEPIEVVSRRRRARGWNAALNAVSATLKELHYQRTAEAFVIVIDGDDSVVHQPEHEHLTEPYQNCRSCLLDAKIADVMLNLPRIGNLPPIRFASTVAVPSIEAWYLFGKEPDCTEAGWIEKQSRTRRPRTRDEILRLKRLVYGSDRAGLRQQTERAEAEARRLAERLDDFESSFPYTFGQFAQQIRCWTDD